MKYFSTRGCDSELSFEEVNPIWSKNSPHLSPILNNRQSWPAWPRTEVFISPPISHLYQITGNPPGQNIHFKISAKLFYPFTYPRMKYQNPISVHWWTNRTRHLDIQTSPLSSRSGRRCLSWSYGMDLHLRLRISRYNSLGTCLSSFWRGRTKQKLWMRRRKDWQWSEQPVAIPAGTFQTCQYVQSDLTGFGVALRSMDYETKLT